MAGGATNSGDPTPLADGERLRVIIADADPLARRVVREELQARREFIVTAEAADGVEALELATHYRPELLITEVTLPRMDGIELVRRLVERAPEVRVLVFAVACEPAVELRAVRAGARGFLSKDVGVQAVAQALHGLMRGEAAISRALTMRLIERLRQFPEAGTGIRPVKSNLTDREWEVLDLLVAGLTTSEIADALFLTEDTIYSHIKNLMRKLEVRTRQEAIEVATRLIESSRAT
ncbi:response regulator [Capillimicrobium parvum]|uniref:Transcriptional regulatory protein DegU n=1 Tax=Capillimicrobium parvum TaxID=2884022 RepID=A0A9E7BZR7_9ACTN|nr:response regulator transcription factor [Capillimicrobium parvum]UGS34618.1 Transcriptional regulatory protein DegU [Capillimicrobium parvum]